MEFCNLSQWKQSNQNSKWVVNFLYSENMRKMFIRNELNFLQDLIALCKLLLGFTCPSRHVALEIHVPS